MDLGGSVEEFFRDQVDQAFRDQGLTPSALAEHYLVQLLAAYAAQPIAEQPLAIKLLEAVEAAPRERRVQLREIGDTSLYLSGFWAESLADKLVDVDYYIDLGGTAYGELARGGSKWTGDPFGDVFAELAANFARFAFNRISKNDSVHSDGAGLLRSSMQRVDGPRDKLKSAAR